MNYIEVEYYLTSELLGRKKLLYEPVNWDEDEKQIVRNTKNWGVYTELSNNLEFVKDGRDLLEDIYNLEGTEAKVTLERFVYRDIDKGFELDYKGNLDMKTYRNENDRITVQFLTGGLQNLIESQFDEPYELSRDTDIDGNDISVINYDKIRWNGRRIFLESKTVAKSENIEYTQSGAFPGTMSMYNFVRLGTENPASVPPPYRKLFQSDGLEVNDVFQTDAKAVNVNPFLGDGSEDPRYRRVTAGDMAFINTTSNTNTFDYRVDYDFTAEVPSIQYADQTSNKDNWQYFDLALLIAVYDFVDNQWVFNRNEVLRIFDGFGGNPDINPFVINQVSGSTGTEFINNLSVQPNQGIMLSLAPIATSIDVPGDVDVRVDIYDFEIGLELEKNSEFNQTEFDTIKVYEAFERMLEIYTGEKGRVKSEYFENGDFKNLTLSSGRFIRNLEDRRLSVELKDLYGISNYFNLGWSVENIDGVEKFVVEPKEYFFVDYPLIRLGEVSKLAISCAEEFLFKSATFGNKKAGDYEEIQGLQEYNGLTTYQTFLKTAETKYDVQGQIRADLVGAELARRKDFSVAPNTDTRYDNENFLFDSKFVESIGNTSVYEPKTWQDQLDAKPNVYDPDTAGNLLLTPFRSMQRHAKNFKAGLTKYPNKLVRYSSGTADVEVTTKLAGEVARSENGNILNSELDDAIYEAEYYEFEFPVDLDMRRLLKGRTVYNGKSTPNTNFLVKFTYRNKNYFGYIVEVGFNGSGNWKLIKKKTA